MRTEERVQHCEEANERLSRKCSFLNETIPMDESNLAKKSTTLLVIVEEVDIEGQNFVAKTIR